jgi:hypothetical protein
MWELWQRAKAFGHLPSDLVEFHGAPRFYLDRAVWAFGTHVEAEVERQRNSTKNEIIARSNALRKFEELMGADMKKSTVGFRDPGSKKAVAVDDKDEEIVLDGGH